MNGNKGDTGEMEFYWFDPPTVPGLARALGMTSKTVIEYAKLDEFEEIITDAKLLIEEYTAMAFWQCVLLRFLAVLP